MNYLVLPPTTGFTAVSDYLTISNAGNLYKIKISDFIAGFGALVGEKGDQGEQGESGATPTLEEVMMAITTLGITGAAGANGRGVASIENTANPLVALVTFTDETTSDLNLPEGADGSDGSDGVGVSTVTQPTDTTILVTLTDSTTQGPFTLPQGADGSTGTTGLGWVSSSGAPSIGFVQPNGTFCIDLTTGDVYNYLEGWTLQLSLKGPAGADATWGLITGTLEDQTDLQEALDALAEAINETGDMLKSVYDPQDRGHISGSGEGGFLSMDDHPTSHTFAGAVVTDGGAGTGATGGVIDTSGGAGTDATGGSIRTSGSTLPGGSIDTSEGGGAISTRGTGRVEFGAVGTRTGVEGTATEDREITLPDANGQLAMNGQPGSFSTLASGGQIAGVLRQDQYQGPNAQCVFDGNLRFGSAYKVLFYDGPNFYNSTADAIFDRASAGTLEISGAVTGDTTALICTGPDGVRYRLEPPTGGGTATWVTV